MNIEVSAPNIHGYHGAMIQRLTYTQRISTALKRALIVALLGARQCGKTTLAGLIS